jgi:hypothetical protein
VEIYYKDFKTIQSATSQLSLQERILDVLVKCGGTSESLQACLSTRLTKCPIGIEVRPLEWDAHDFEDVMEIYAVMVAVRLPIHSTTFPTSLPLKSGHRGPS